MATEDEIRTWPRRGQAAKRLGKSVATLRRYEGKLIKPVTDSNGEHRFNPQELEALASSLKKRRERKAAAKVRKDASRPTPSRDAPPPESRVSGANSKRAFEMFGKNGSRAEVVIELGESVENVDWLYERYLVMSGRMSAEAAQRFVRGAEVPTAPKREERSPQWELSDAQIVAVPIESLDETDRARRRWVQEINARKASFEEQERRPRIAEQAATSPKAEGSAQGVGAEGTLAGPRTR